jgi:hypothetical protein
MKTLLLSLLCAAAFAAAPALAKPKVTRIEAPKNILFIGNSFNYYNNSLHGHLRMLWRTADPGAEKKMVFKSETISGGFLHEHAAALPALLESRKWDVVILQGNSAEPLPKNRKHHDDFVETAKKFDRQIDAAGAQTAFFMTWAYQDKPEMTGELAAEYEAVGNDTDALVVPVGLAFAKVREARPSLVMHVEDKMHPTLPGTYLAACTFYAALFGKTPVGNAYNAGLDPELAKFLQQAAWDTVRRYYGWT